MNVPRSTIFAALFCVALSAPAAAACAPPANNGEQAEASGVEYRLRAEAGHPFAWPNGKEERLGVLAFMTCGDFAKAFAHPSKNPNSPGQYEVELPHSAIGKAKLRAVADADRDRGYCLLLNGTVLTCVEFAPPQKGVWVDGATIYGFADKAAAQSMADALNKALAGN